VASFKVEVEEPSSESSDFKLHTSNFRRAAGWTSCSNKPNSPSPGGAGAAPELIVRNEPNFHRPGGREAIVQNKAKRRLSVVSSR
jgi:hypothetical protein